MKAHTPMEERKDRRRLPYRLASARAIAPPRHRGEHAGGKSGACAEAGRYWEGLIDIAGTRDGRAVNGHGYLELTGYAGAIVGLSGP